MIAVEVEKAPPYVALSYTWGNKHLSRAISINGSEANITANLADAIDDIFDFARSRDLMFWADSICINQGDVNERSSQVRLMNTIYRSAEMVTIWLGPAADDSDEAFKRMEEWSERLDMFKEQHGVSQLLALPSIRLDDGFFFRPGTQKIVRAVRMICRRPWWSRAWVVQEGSVASKERTILFCGKHNINWACWRAALKITHWVNGDNAGSIDFEEGMPTRLDAFRQNREQGAYVRLLGVLRLLRAYDCEDDRDKVYAALGMAMDVHEDDLVPDYQKSYRAVCSDVVEFYVSKLDRHTFEFLGSIFRPAPDTCIDFGSNTYQLPSWIPDWTCQVVIPPFEKNLNMDSFDTTRNAYNASGALPVVCRIEKESLHLQGAVLDRIIEVRRVCEWNLRESGLEVEMQWAPANPDDPYVAGGTLMQAFNHTITADIGRRNPDDKWELSRGFQADWALLQRSTVYMTVHERCRQKSMMMDIKTVTFGRRLFMTSKGYMGLGPAAAKVDDKVCMFSGGQVLYVVRGRKDPRFEFVGECYVHGLMDGEACEDESFHLRDIVLE